MKELEELPTWWGEGISSSLSSSSSPLEDEGWKSNMQILLLSRNMEKEFARWRFNFRREKKYHSANQATLQMKSNEFRIIPFYSYNDIAITSPSNLLISQKVNQPNNGIRRNWNCCRRILMFNLGQHSITKIPIPFMPTFKQYPMAIWCQSPLTLYILLTSSPRIQRHLKNHKGAQNEKRPSHNQVPNIQKKKKERGGEGLTSSAVKLSITNCQISKEHLEGVDKWCLGNQCRNLEKIPGTSSQISGPTPKYSYIQT